MEKVKFRFNGKIYQTGNLLKKLSQLGITEKDIEMIVDTPDEINEIKLYHFKNKINGHTITTSKLSLDDLSHLYNIDDWEMI